MFQSFDQNAIYRLEQAAIIVVYAYGFLTLMARGILDGDKNSLTEGIVAYFPLIPSLQVLSYIVSKSPHRINQSVIFINISVLHFPFLVKFWPCCSKSVWIRWFRHRHQALVWNSRSSTNQLITFYIYLIYCKLNFCLAGFASFSKTLHTEFGRFFRQHGQSEWLSKQVTIFIVIYLFFCSLKNDITTQHWKGVNRDQSIFKDTCYDT